MKGFENIRRSEGAKFTKKEIIVGSNRMHDIIEIHKQPENH